MNSVGTRNEHDEVNIVSGFSDWSQLINKDTNSPNGVSFYFPRIEYTTQILYFFLNITIIKVIERVATLALVITFLTWLAGLWQFEQAVPKPD